VDIGEYEASVDRINELHAELPGEQDQTSELDVKVELLNTNWKNFNTAVDKVAWMKIPVCDKETFVL
jgi:archaellum component FlaC